MGEPPKIPPGTRPSANQLHAIFDVVKDVASICYLRGRAHYSDTVKVAFVVDQGSVFLIGTASLAPEKARKASVEIRFQVAMADGVCTLKGASAVLSALWTVASPLLLPNAFNAGAEPTPIVDRDAGKRVPHEIVTSENV